MNPFEIRLELLKLAQQIENERVMSERIRLENDWQAQSLNGKAVNPFPTVPTVSVEDVIKAAEALNAFVSKKDA
jgi:hypothetical protein